jgi:outer membrane protein assembly factor BamB
MSTDTDYIITIKGKDAALRKAAADYIELLLKPWTPQRNNKKTLIRIDVFRNESNSGGFLTPSSLCKEAAELFPGTDVSFESNNEYGNTQEGQWNEEGSPPKDINGTVAVKALERIQTEVGSLQNRVDWLNPLALWASNNQVQKKTVALIEGALKDAEKAKNEEIAALEAKAERVKEKVIAGAEALESTALWSFHPVQATRTRPVGRVGKSMLCQASFGVIDEERNVWGDIWAPSQRENADAGLDEGCGSVGVGSSYIPDSKAAEKFFTTQLYDTEASGEGPHIFIQTPKGIRGLGAHLCKHEEAFLWIHSREYPSDGSFKVNIRKSLKLAKRLEGGTVSEIIDESELCGDKQQCPSGWQPRRFGQEIASSLAVSRAQVFIASDNALPSGPALGRFFSLSLSDGTITWVSELRFHECSAIVVPDPSALLAVVKIDNATILVSIETATGKERWRMGLSQPSGSRFYLSASKETAVILSTSLFKGACLSWWRVESGVKIAEKPLPEDVSEEIVMDGTQVYAGSKDWVKAFSHDGEEIWTTHLPKGDVWSSCKITLTGNHTVLISRGQKGITCLSCETGATSWVFEEENAWDCLVGGKDTAFYFTGEAYVARNICDGSLLWRKSIPSKEEDDFSAIPAAVTEKVLLVVNNNGFLDWFDVETGAHLGSVGISTRSKMIMTHDGYLVCIGSFWIGPNQVICLDLKVGTPKGPWPMHRQGEGCAAFLPTVEKNGYKQFIRAWKANENLSPRLARLGLTEESNRTDNARAHGIIRGHEMIAQAKLWAEPSIGPGKTAPARGRQWRLVMSYGGLELLIKSLGGTKGNGLDGKILENLLGKISLPTFEPLEPPAIEKSSLKEWIEEEDASDVLDFLRMENGDRSRFDAWLTKQQAVATWGDGVLLAKALRSATVHGALSPTKIMEWKLGETLSILTEHIFRIDEAFFEVLGKTL